MSCFTTRPWDRTRTRLSAGLETPEFPLKDVEKTVLTPLLGLLPPALGQVVVDGCLELQHVTKIWVNGVSVMAAALSGTGGGFKIKRRTETDALADAVGRVQQLPLLEGAAADV